MLFQRQKTDWLLVVLTLVGLFLYASYQPRLRLRTEMPIEFVDRSAHASHNAQERNTAEAYWRCLVDDVQWRYGFGHTLPGEAPAEFSLGTQKGSANEDPSTRMRYWRQAQHLWYARTSWKQEYEWSFAWTTGWVENGIAWVQQRFEHLGGG